MLKILKYILLSIILYVKHKIFILVNIYFHME